MIKSISLQNFKCYQEETHFDLKPINLLTGINGKGKSTLLQSLLLFKQSIDHNPLIYNLLLNGNCVRLGSFNDVKNSHTPNRTPISLTFAVNQGKFKYIFKENETDERTLKFQEFLYSHETESIGFNEDKAIIYKSLNSTFQVGKLNNNHGIFDSFLPHQLQLVELFSIWNPQPSKKWWETLYSLSFHNLYYVSADRLGPQEFYEKIDMNDLRVGKKGEFVAQVLANAQKSQMIVDELLALSKNRLLVAQASEWLGHVLGHPNISLEVNDDNRYTISLTFKMGTKSYTMPNVGFGYSYILPIIVSGLIAKPNQILIIENPEAHLHPRAQSRLAHFLAKVAKTGVQVFIESHSDHILNALRVAVKNKNLNPDDLQIFYFAENPDEDAPNIFTPQVDEDGRIDEWPDGFFDEWNNNLMELL